MKKLIFIIFIFSSYYNAVAQLSSSDISLLSKTTYIPAKDFAYYNRKGNSRKPMQFKKKKGIAHYNPISFLLTGGMWLYQNVISPQLSSSCPYQITCSNFAKQCIEQYGIVKGMALAADRLMRDNRISILDIPPMEFDPKTHHILDNPNRYKWRQ